jgi:hypothetical protein
MNSILSAALRNSRALCLLAVAATLGSAHAATITGVSATPSNPTAGQQVMFTITMSGGGQCGVRLVYGGNNEPSDNVMFNSGPNTGVSKTMAKAGTYNVQAIGSPTLSPGCTGQAAMTLVVKEKPAISDLSVSKSSFSISDSVSIAFKTAGTCGPVKLIADPGNKTLHTFPSVSQTAGIGLSPGVLAPGNYTIKAIPEFPLLAGACSGSDQASVTVTAAPVMQANLAGAFSSVVPHCPPAPYKEGERNTQTGKLHCYQPNPSCPAGWKQASFSDATGQLQCVINAEPACPAGFDGDYANGVLKCLPKPQPKVACAPGALPANPWGTSYYKEGWNRLGCSVNLAPPK